MPKRLLTLCIVAWSLCFSPLAFAPDPDGFLGEFGYPDPLGTKEFGFLTPNERYPQDLEPILSRTGPGAYISVGTERGFIAFSMSNATHLVLVDVDPQVAEFNRINRMLLAASTSREDYLRLRMSRDFTEWQRAAKGFGGRVSLAALGEPATFERWKTARTSGSPATEFLSFAGLETPNAISLAEQQFLKGNYLHDEMLFARVRAAAREGRIQVENFNLATTGNFRVLINKLREKGIGLSVFDVSNAWRANFLGRENSAKLIDECRAIMDGKSLFLCTDRIKPSQFDKTQPAGAPSRKKAWVYTAYPFSFIDSLGGSQWFLDFLYEETSGPSRKSVPNGVTDSPDWLTSCRSQLRLLGPL